MTLFKNRTFQKLLTINSWRKIAVYSHGDIDADFIRKTYTEIKFISKYRFHCNLPLLNIKFISLKYFLIYQNLHVYYKFDLSYIFFTYMWLFALKDRISSYYIIALITVIQLLCWLIFSQFKFCLHSMPYKIPGRMNLINYFTVKYYGAYVCYLYLYYLFVMRSTYVILSISWAKSYIIIAININEKSECYANKLNNKYWICLASFVSLKAVVNKN